RALLVVVAMVRRDRLERAERRDEGLARGERPLDRGVIQARDDSGISEEVLQRRVAEADVNGPVAVVVRGGVVIAVFLALVALIIVTVAVVLYIQAVRLALIVVTVERELRAPDERGSIPMERDAAEGDLPKIERGVRLADAEADLLTMRIVVPDHGRMRLEVRLWCRDRDVEGVGRRLSTGRRGHIGGVAAGRTGAGSDRDRGRERPCPCLARRCVERREGRKRRAYVHGAAIGIADVHVDRHGASLGQRDVTDRSDRDRTQV